MVTSFRFWKGNSLGRDSIEVWVLHELSYLAWPGRLARSRVPIGYRMFGVTFQLILLIRRLFSGHIQYLLEPPLDSPVTQSESFASEWVVCVSKGEPFLYRIFQAHNYHPRTWKSKTLCRRFLTTSHWLCTRKNRMLGCFIAVMRMNAWLTRYTTPWVGDTQTRKGTRVSHE